MVRRKSEGKGEWKGKGVLTLITESSNGLINYYKYIIWKRIYLLLLRVLQEHVALDLVGAF
jgi:hypothetical protein